MRPFALQAESNNHLVWYGADTQEGMGHSPRTKDARACNGAELLVADLKDKLAFQHVPPFILVGMLMKPGSIAGRGRTFKHNKLTSRIGP